MLLWTAFPITVLLELIWERYIKPVLDRRNQRANSASSATSRSTRDLPIEHLALVPPAHWLELLAVLERCLCFSHTGAAPSLAYALMKRTFTSRALLEGYLPMFSDVLEIPVGVPLYPRLHLHQWPVDLAKEPLLASKRAQALTYGSAHLSVRLCTTFYHSFHLADCMTGLHCVFQDPASSLKARGPLWKDHQERTHRPRSEGLSRSCH